MLDNFKPTWMMESIYQLSPEMLKEQGIKAIFTDLDNTLIAWNNPYGTPELLGWIEQVKASGIPVIIVSNNSVKRIKVVADHLGLEFVARSLKPSKSGYRRAAKKLAVPLADCVMVGDQLITDIQGANRAGVRSILVKPIVASDAWNTSINRFFERFIMRYLLKRNPDMKWRNELD